MGVEQLPTDLVDGRLRQELRDATTSKVELLLEESSGLGSEHDMWGL